MSPVLHYIHQSDEGNIKSSPVIGSDGTVFSRGGTYSVACSPQATELSGNLRATDEITLVNCDQCKNSDVYKQHLTDPSIRQGALLSTLRGHK